jgi:hypothetical protein
MALALRKNMQIWLAETVRSIQGLVLRGSPCQFKRSRMYTDGYPTDVVLMCHWITSRAAAEKLSCSSKIICQLISRMDGLCSTTGINQNVMVVILRYKYQQASIASYIYINIFIRGLIRQRLRQF